MKLSAGAKFRQAVQDNDPLQIVGTVNPYCAMMAKNLGHQAIYLSGGGIANASYGLPDLGITTLNDVLVDVERITNACDLPLLVDIDTGFGGAFNIARTIRAMEKAALLPFIWKTKWLRNAVVIDQIKRLLVSKRWSIESKRQPMLEPMTAL